MTLSARGLARGLLAGVAVAVIAAVSASAEPTIRLRPTPQHHSTLLSEDDFDRLKSGLDAADRGNWSRVRSNANAMTDSAAADILRWRAATSDQSISFSELEVAAVR